MRVLLVTHRFLPEHRAGTEQHVAALARGLRDRGHDVRVLTAEKDLRRTDLTLHRRTWEGLLVHEWVDNLLLEVFEETWNRPAAGRALEEVLDEFAPDVVHVHHLMYGSVGSLAAVRQRGIALLLTLHDYWLECGRMGQLMAHDGGICEVVDHARCGPCLARTPWRQPRGASFGAPLVRAAGRLPGVVPLAQRLARRKGSAPEPDAAEEERFTRAARRRQDGLVSAVRQHVQRVLAPSEFLAARTRALGIEQVEVLPSGVPELPQGERPARESRLSLLFLGTLVPAKGADLLLEAWSGLSKEARAQGTLTLHGPGGHDPAYEARLEALAVEGRATLGGALDREGVQLALARADVLVMPSRWYENRPTVLLEALAVGTPCLVAGSGGMAELVRPGTDGWHFRIGDVTSLREQLAARLADPAGTRALRPSATHLPTVAYTLARIEELYEELRSGGTEA